MLGKCAQLKTEGDENQGSERPSDFLKVTRQIGNWEDWCTEVGLAVRKTWEDLTYSHPI